MTINSNLFPIFYWGYGSPGNNIPNSGFPVSDIRSPQWVSSDSMLVASSAVLNGVAITGVFAVHFDPDSLIFERVTEYAHTNGLRSIRWDGTTGTLLALDYPTPFSTRILRCHLSSNTLVVDDEVVDSSWRPEAVCLWSGHDGIVFSGTDPMSGVGGIYWRRPGGALDSLLYEPDQSALPVGPIAVTADGTNLLVALNSGNGMCHMLSVSIQETAEIDTVLTRSHLPVGVFASPVDPDIAAFVYWFSGDDTNPPQDAVEVVRLSTKVTDKLNVKTHAPVCRFTRVESVAWDPSGQAIAFTSGAESSEGQRYLFRLWVLRPGPLM